MFEIRRQLLKFAHVTSDQSPVELIVCSINYRFTCFPDIITGISIIGEHARRQDRFPSTDFFNHRKEDTIRAACQLPRKLPVRTCMDTHSHVNLETWEQLPCLLQSAHASPASKRLAVALLFSAFVVQPDGGCHNTWLSVSFFSEVVRSNELIQEHRARIFDNMLTIPSA